MPRLTPEQEAQIPFYAYKWRDISYSTEPIDREKVVEVINRAYSLIGKKCPPIAFCGSPFDYIQKVSVYSKNIQLPSHEKLIDYVSKFRLKSTQDWIDFPKLGKDAPDVREQIQEIFNIPLEQGSPEMFDSSNLKLNLEQFRAEKKEDSQQFRQELKQSLSEFEFPEDLGKCLNIKLECSNELFFTFHRTDDELNQSIRNVLNDACINRNGLNYLIEDAIRPFIQNLVPNLIHNSISASSSADNYRWFDVRITLLAAECDRERWEASVDILQNCGTVYPFEKICFVCDRPTKLLFDENGYIHALGEPAIAYADGFQIFAYHGKLMSGRYTAIPLSQWESQWYEDESDSRLKQALIEVLPADQLKSEWLLEEENAILQQNLIDKIGHTRILNELKIVDDLNILSEALQNGSSSGLRVAWTILQNRTEPKIQSVIEKWQVTGGGFNKLRKMIMLDSLERILNWYKLNVPNYIEDFLPGLSYEQIEDQVKDIPFKLPQEVYDLYQWRNGNSNYESGPIFIYHHFSSLEEAFEIDHNYDPVMVELRTQNLYPPYLFTIFEFEGEYFAIEVSTEQTETALLFHIGADGEGETLVFNSLTTMIMAIAESYESGVYRYDPEGERVDWEDQEKSKIIRLKYNIGTTKQFYT